MPKHNSLKTNQEASLRAKQIKATIRKFKRQIQKISSQGEVAPPHCHVIRYQTKQNQKIYWYYKLQASEPIFSTATDSNQKSKYLYLGKAGSSAHIDAVERVTRRGLIDELERVINSLHESYLNVCFGGETEADPSQYCSVKEGCPSKEAGGAGEAGEAGGEKTGLSEQYCDPSYYTEELKEE